MKKLILIIIFILLVACNKKDSLAIVFEEIQSQEYKITSYFGNDKIECSSLLNKSNYSDDFLDEEDIIKLEKIIKTYQDQAYQNLFDETYTMLKLILYQIQICLCNSL